MKPALKNGRNILPWLGLEWRCLEFIVLGVNQSPFSNFHAIPPIQSSHQKRGLDHPTMANPSTPTFCPQTTQWERVRRLPSNPNYPPHITIKLHCANRKPYDHMITVFQANVLTMSFEVFVFSHRRLFYVIGCVVCKKKKKEQKKDESSCKEPLSRSISKAKLVKRYQRKALLNEGNSKCVFSEWSAVISVTARRKSPSSTKIWFTVQDLFDWMLGGLKNHPKTQPKKTRQTNNIFQLQSKTLFLISIPSLVLKFLPSVSVIPDWNVKVSHDHLSLCIFSSLSNEQY